MSTLDYPEQGMQAGGSTILLCGEVRSGPGYVMKSIQPGRECDSGGWSSKAALTRATPKTQSHLHVVLA